MTLDQRGANHQMAVVDKYHDPAADYSMTARDYVLRPTVAAAAITITLPIVTEAKGRFYSIRARGNVTVALPITIQDNDESEGWEGDIILYAVGQGCLIYSDGVSWMLRTFADIEVESSTRGQYSKARVATGEATAGRFRGEAAGATAVASANGVHAQGIAYGDLFAATVNAIYAEAIAKGGTTVTTLRGAMIAADSEGTPTAISLMIGCHIRVKSSVAPSTYIALKIENEKFGTGMPVDSFIDIRTATWAAGNTVATNIIDMSALVGTVTNIFDLGGVTATYLFRADAAGDGGIIANTNTLTLTETVFHLMIDVAGTPYYVPVFDKTTWN
jgi:hypothetical protein